MAAWRERTLDATITKPCDVYFALNEAFQAFPGTKLDKLYSKETLGLGKSSHQKVKVG